MLSLQTSLGSFACSAIFTTALVCSVNAATVVNNGDFENWNGNNLVGWSTSANSTATNVSGLGGGSAALIGLASTNSEAHLKGTLTSAIGPQSGFSFSVDFLQPVMTSTTTDRGFNVTLRGGGNTILNFAVLGNQLNSTQTVNSTPTFAPVADNVTLTADTWYRLVVTGNLGTNGRYTVELFDLSSGSSTPIISEANQNRWQSYPGSATTFTEIRLERGRSMTDWTADNVTMIPEPSAAALASAGLIGLAIRRKRRA